MIVVPESADKQHQDLMDSVHKTLNEPNCLATSFEMPKEETKPTKIVAEPEPEKFDMNKSVVLQNLVTPKQAYFKKIAEIAHPKYKENLETIYDIGMVDFDANLAALIQHENNVEAALNQLFGAN